MPKYELIGRLVFRARNLKDAFRRLADHFEDRAAGYHSHLPEVGTDIKLRAEGEEEPDEDERDTIPPPPRLPREHRED